MKNNEEVYMRLWNIQQQTIECVEVYYEHLLKLINCLQGKTIDVFFTIIFRVGLLFVVTTKSTSTCTNCGKTSHTLETYHNKKIEVPVVSIVMVKSTKPLVETKTQLVKLVRILVHYPHIIYSNAKHRFGECPMKIEVQNMFKRFKGSCVQEFKV